MIHDLRNLGHDVLNQTNNEGEMTSLVLLTTYGGTKGTTVIAGEPRKICESLAEAMHNNPPFREMFETAWAAITKAQVGLN